MWVQVIGKDWVLFSVTLCRALENWFLGVLWPILGAESLTLTIVWCR